MLRISHMHHSLKCQALVTPHWLIRLSLMLASQRRSSEPVDTVPVQCWMGLTGAGNCLLHCQYGSLGGNARLTYF